MALGDSFTRLGLQALLWEAIALLGRAERVSAAECSIWVARAEAYLRDHCGEPIGLGEWPVRSAFTPGTWRAASGQARARRSARGYGGCARIGPPS